MASSKTTKHRNKLKTVLGLQNQIKKLKTIISDAKTELQGNRILHSDSCRMYKPRGDDNAGGCSCGAKTHNDPIDNVLEILRKAEQ